MTDHSNQQEETTDVPMRGRVTVAVVGILTGLLMIGLGIQFTAWFFTSSTSTETSVSCDDEFYYDEDEVDVEYFEQAEGIWCHRSTKETSDWVVDGWPLWLTAPTVILACVLIAALVLGGTVLAVLAVAFVSDRVMRDDITGWVEKQIAGRKR